MYDVRMNPFENYITVTVKGKLEINDIQALAVRLLSDVKRLQPGFIVISDISEMAPASEDGRLVIQDAMRALREAGLGQAIRVVAPAMQITANQMQRTSRAAGYTAIEVASVAEAERTLDMV